MKIPEKIATDAKPKRPARSGLFGRGIGLPPRRLSDQPMISNSVEGMIRRAALPGLALLALATAAVAGDILRSGATADPSRRNAAARANAGAEAAASAKRTAEDRLARTTKVIESLRRPNVASGSSSIPAGLVPGGLVVANPGSWLGANLPTQNGGTVTVVQTAQTAQLYWESFNIGRTTTLRFDQSAGGTDIGKWIAFNNIVGNGATRIAGTLIAPGQAYIINPNGIRFEAGAQVTARTLVASSLPINSNLINQGLLNNRDAQFLFSTLEVPGGSDGTPAFIPPPPPVGDHFGDITVQAGALLSSASSADGNGGRIMLVGANVSNDGVIETPAGQTILAAGLQVGVQAHRQDDPSLRGLDVWVGNVGDYSGKIQNRGLIEAQTGSIVLVGREIKQLGALDSSTSVSLNGRIDIFASYGAVGNPNFDNSATSGFGGPIFLNQFTGSIQFGPDSVTRILPDLSSGKKIPGTKLPESSQINLLGQSVYLDRGSIVMAPAGKISIRAGVWPYKDTNNDRLANEVNLSSFYSGSTQRLLFSSGQVYLAAGSLLDASGTTQAFVPLANHILTVQLRGSELADSPLLRNSNLRGINLVVDIRRSGVYGGREWVGSPLGDLTGLAGIVERDVAQLTAGGGTITMEAGDSVVVANSAVVDVSGGTLLNEGGRIQTSRLIRGGNNLIDMDNATPDVTYDGIYEGQSTTASKKWGISKTYKHALAPLGGYNQREYIEGASGGLISLNAPILLLEGDLRGRTVKGPRQLDSPPQQGRLKLAFQGEKMLTLPDGSLRFLANSPFPPRVEFIRGLPSGTVPSFVLAGESPQAMSPSLGTTFKLGSALYEDDEGGFGHVQIANADGDFVLGAGRPVELPAGGSLVVTAKNVRLDANLVAPGGILSFTAYNFSPYLYNELEITGGLANRPAPAPVPGRGLVSVGAGVVLSVAGMMVDDRITAPVSNMRHREIDGGNINLEAYSIDLGKGSLLDASGGIQAKATKGFSYGNGGDIFLLSGKDPNLDTTIGGKLSLGGALMAYGGRKGGSLTIQTNFIQIGGGGAPEDTLLLQPDFFQKGGFTSYSLIGIGGRTADGGMRPAVRLVSGTIIQPISENYVLTPYSRPLGLMGVRPYLKPAGIRPATSLSLRGLGADDPYIAPGQQGTLEALGLVVLEQGSKILTDPGASVTIQGDAVSILGTIEAPGGKIDIKGASSFRTPSDIASAATFALPTVFIGSQARLSTAGTTVYLQDPFGRRSGIIYPGGSIKISGNILAEAGAVLDVSGTSAVLDFHPTRLGEAGTPLVPQNAGLNALPWGRRGVPVRVDSDGGLIELSGSQMLYSDATLIGRAGGPTALGGSLSVSSGRFYQSGASRTGADINLIVEQSGNAVAFGDFGSSAALLKILFGAGASFESSISSSYIAGLGNPGIGYFAVDQFQKGGFDNLDLGYYYLDSASPIPYGGNVEFRGPVSINARGFVRLAGGGVIRANAPVTVNAAYAAIGQKFRQPLNPLDVFVPFQEFTGSETKDYFFAPEPGAGSLSVDARLIDVGTVSLMGISRASLAAKDGDIRGSGTLSIAGDLLLTAAQVYPTTLATFNIFAYPFPGGSGSVTITGSGQRRLPISGGGSLNIYASVINQRGTLRAPLGAISLGWDGTDLDPSTAVMDSPFNPVVGTITSTPTASLVTLAPGSVTSISGVDPHTGEGILVPLGISPDGLTWIDPRGVNITVSGLPNKTISIAGDSVVTSAGSIIDLRGGGDFFSYRWLSGTGGSADILGTASATWSATSTYAAGDLVNYNGQTWSARVGIDPSDYVTSPVPTPSLYWRLIPESYAILPGFGSEFSPYNVYNTGTNAGDLGGDPGFVASSLRLGEQIYLEPGAGLSGGFYTLLPRRYGVLPGALLVIPQEDKLVGSAVPRNTLSPALGGAAHPIGSALREEGSSFVSGYTFNAFQTPRSTPRVLSRFELVPYDVLANRAKYDVYYANEFMTEAAGRLGLDQVQRLPADSGSLAIHGNIALSLSGSVLSKSVSGGRGSNIDISSFSEIYIAGEGASVPGGLQVVLNPRILESWGADSLLIGGLRRQTSGGISVQVRTNSLTLDNPNSVFSGPDITLLSNRFLTLTDGSSLVATGGMTQPAQSFLISGDGTLLRVSSDVTASVVRTNVSGSNLPLLTIGAGARMAGESVTLDSTYASDVDPTASAEATALTMASGQISILLEPQAGPLPGTIVNPHLILDGTLLQQAESAKQLTLQSYRSIDIYGDGQFGRSNAERLRLFSSGIRGFAQGPLGTGLVSTEIVFANPVGVPSIAAPPGAPVGTLSATAQTLRFGLNTFEVSGYQNVNLVGTGGALAENAGTFKTASALQLTVPLLTAARSVNYNFQAGGALQLLAGTGTSTVQPGLGASLSLRGTSVNVDSTVNLPSGLLNIEATTGDLAIGGRLLVEGTSKQFNDLMRFTDGGEIQLVANAGNVTLNAGSILSVAANAGGGNAGRIAVEVPNGTFTANGQFTATAGSGGKGGLFALDARTLDSFDDLRDILNAGGFTESRNLRVRTGHVIVSGTSTVREFILSADGALGAGDGDIDVTGTIYASGNTGGRIELIAKHNLTLQPSAVLTVAAQNFSNAGKGGHVYLEAGASTGGSAGTGTLGILANSRIDLSVAEYQQGASALPNGDYLDPTSSAFLGKFRGTLHLRAPQISANTDVAVNSIQGTITGASSILVEGYRIYTPAGGVAGNTLRNQINTQAASFINPNEGVVGVSGMRNKLIGGTINAGLDSILVVAPGAEIVNTSGNIVLGSAGTNNGTNPADDWNLATFRYGSRGAPGVLTFRAAGDLVFQNALSDGFAGLTAQQGSQPTGRQLWLANLMTINPNLPVNQQSWSYRLAAGADLAAADFRQVTPLASLAANSGSLRLGNFYTGTLGGTGASATTAAAIAPGVGTTTRFQVIRTGTGGIDIAVGRDVQLRNQFATIYTAGVGIPTPTQIFSSGDFSTPVVQLAAGPFHPDQTALGVPQQIYPAQWAMSGGNIDISAQASIARIARVGLNEVIDSSRQLPTNWLYRRGQVDSTTGLFAVGGVDAGLATVNDPSASTAWWIDYSNFFEGFGALGGGNISLSAGLDIVNSDAFVPTNARMAGLSAGNRIAPNPDNLLEYGGGDISVRAGRNIDGGVYYVERGNAILTAGNEIKTNEARTPSRYIINATPEVRDPLTWLPTTLFLGRGAINVSARGNLLLGPVANVGLMPQGVNNKFWYKTYFQTYGEKSSVEVSSLGGDVTHRLSTVLQGSTTSRNILQAWLETQNVFAGANAALRASNTQPWIRIAETSIAPFATSLSIAPPILRTTSFSGDINMVGNLNLFPAPAGTIELAAADAVNGLNPAGRATAGSPAVSVLAWTSARINLSDSDPSSSPGITNPFAYQDLVGRDGSAQAATRTGFLAQVDSLFNETGSFSGVNSSINVKRSLHATTPVHLNDPEPLRIYAMGGDLSGLTLFSSKFSQITAQRDITDISFYLQNVSADNVSIVSAGRDVIPYNENSPLRSLASDLAKGNILVDPVAPTVLTTATGAAATTRVLQGDIQINGPGYLEVLAGRNLDLGTGPNRADGTGAGITSIGRSRNPFLPFEGAELVVFAGVKSKQGGAALGLLDSSLIFDDLLGSGSTSADEVKAIDALASFFAILRQAGSEFQTTGSYESAFAAISQIFGDAADEGEIFTRARDIRTTSGGGITIAAPGGGLTMAPNIFGNPLTPPGIVTEYGGPVSIFTKGDVDIGQARIFTLRGGDLTIWSSEGDIAAGTAPKTVVTAPPTRVLIDSTSADIQTDLGGLATGGGIGVLASVEGVKEGSVTLLAPLGTVDAGDAGIRATGDITIAAAAVLNADNISAGGTSTGVPSAPTVAAPNIGGLSSAASSTGATTAAADNVAQQARPTPTPEDETPSTIEVEVLGYGGGEE